MALPKADIPPSTSLVGRMLLPTSSWQPKPSILHCKQRGHMRTSSTNASLRNATLEASMTAKGSRAMPYARQSRETPLRLWHLRVPRNIFKRRMRFRQSCSWSLRRHVSSKDHLCGSVSFKNNGKCTVFGKILNKYNLRSKCVRQIAIAYQSVPLKC